ncbi:MAG: DUF4351 domain-containing protein [Blastocatellia bacterium]|nr:DUF4351 domain-containing protein [Blastocatellia bacterium]
MSSYVTSVERLAKEEGLKEGLAHEQRLILKQLQKRFGSVPTEVEEAVKKLDVDGLESFGEAIFDFNSIDDLLAWLLTEA